MTTNWVKGLTLDYSAVAKMMVEKEILSGIRHPGNTKQPIYVPHTGW